MKKIFLILIFCLALFLRLYKLESFPVGFLWDEASLGYNAYSVLQTGKDEYGKWLPLVFKSFGDYKPGFYVYLTIPSIFIFGLNEFAVRFPSAFLGSLSVIIFYLLVDQNQKNKSLALIGGFLLAISPWSLIFSRGSWELNIMLFELLFGFYLLSKFLSVQKNKFLYFSILFFILTIPTYQASKFLLPALLLGFLFFYKKEIAKVDKKKVYIFSGIIFTFFILFNLLTLFGGKGGRVKVMSVFSYPRPEEEKNMLLSQDNSQILYKIFHNDIIFFVRAVGERYFNYFSGKFLFISGDWSNQRNGIVYQGEMYLFDVFFLLLGIGILFSKKRNSFENFMLYWLVIAPLPGALTRDAISSVRSFPMVIPLLFLVSVGMLGFYNFLKKNKKVIQIPVFLMIGFIYLFLFIRLVDLYFTHDPIYSSQNRLYGYKQAIDYINPFISSKNKVIFTTKLGQPYIFYLFYTKYDPAVYQKKAVLTENPFGDVGEVEKIDNIEFRQIYWPSDQDIHNSLFVGDEFDLPILDIINNPNATVLKEVNYFNNKLAFRIVETK